MCFNLIPIPFWPRSAGYLSGYPAMSSSDSTLIKFGVAILVLVLSSCSLAQILNLRHLPYLPISALPISALPKNWSTPPKKRKRDAWPFASPSVKCRTTVLFVQFLFRFDIIHRPSDPPTLWPIKMSFPQNTSYIDVGSSYIAQKIYPSFSHLMSSLDLEGHPHCPSDLWNSQMWTMTWAWKALIPIGSQG